MKAIALALLAVLSLGLTAQAQDIPASELESYKTAAAAEAKLSASINDRLVDLARAEADGHTHQAAETREQLRVLRIRRDVETWRVELLVGIHGSAIRGSGRQPKMPPTADVESHWRGRQAAAARASLVQRLRGIEHIWTHNTQH